MAAEEFIAKYKQLRAAWVSRRGVGATSTSTGAQLPKMIASDGIALMGPFSAAVLRFLEARQIKSASGDWAWEPESAAGLGSGDIAPQDWLMRGVPSKSSAWQRTCATGLGIKLPLSPIIDTRGLLGRGSIGTEAGRQLVAAWQAAINLCADCMRGAGGISRTMSAVEIEAFWSKLYATVIALDVAGETPYQGDWALAIDLAETTGTRTQEVVVQAAEIAGRAAAEIAQTAGEALGSAAGGFFSQAGLTALLVTAGAVYIALA